MLALPTLDREATFLAFDGDVAVGFVFIEDDATARDTFIDLTAPPGPWRHTVHEVGIARGLEAAQRHREGTPGARTVRAGAWLPDTELIADLGAQGLVPVRRFHRMHIDSSSPAIPATMPPLPDGVDIVVSDDEATRRRICDVDNEAFADHWHFTPREYDEWWSLWEKSPSRDPQGWWLLTVDGEDAGICLLDEGRAELGEGYVAILGVRRKFRGRGLAQLLLRRAFVHYRELGRTATQLGVDAENLTGAVRLYEGVGMAAVQTRQGHALELA
jgi:ribosomal protein S18 acetylase RimI-like enzyme